MARLARMIVPGGPRHVTQRGNRRERIFFEAVIGPLDGLVKHEGGIARDDRPCWSRPV